MHGVSQDAKAADNARMSPTLVRFPLCILALSLAALSARAQTEPQAPVDPELPSVLAPTQPRAAAHDRFNAGATLFVVHDSGSGWYTLVTPAAMYTFSRHIAADISMPVYLYRLADVSTTTTPVQIPGAPPVQPITTTTRESRTFDPGDILIAARFSFEHKRLFDVVSPSITLPSGNASDGLSTGHVTFDFDNHSQFNLRRSALVLDVGGGNSSNLVDPLVTRDYSSLGPLAHFQLGMMAAMPFGGIFQSVAYEQLPLGDSKIYTTIRRRGAPPQTVVSGRSVSEDNGFTSSLAIPLTDHLRLEGYYNRSLRLHLDTAGIGISFFLRRTPIARRSTPDLSLVR